MTYRKPDYDALWRDPKFVALNARKDKLGAAWNRADAFQSRPGGSSPAEVARLLKLFLRACERLNDYADASVGNPTQAQNRREEKRRATAERKASR